MELANHQPKFNARRKKVEPDTSKQVRYKLSLDYPARDYAVAATGNMTVEETAAELRKQAARLLAEEASGEEG